MERIAKQREQGMVESIARAIRDEDEEADADAEADGGTSLLGGVLSACLDFFRLFSLRLDRESAAQCRQLRAARGVDEREYRSEFEQLAVATGQHGLSGAVFVRSGNEAVTVKSVARSDEWQFLQHILDPYLSYVVAEADSTLVPIWDVLVSRSVTLGRMLEITPSRYIVMANALRDVGGEGESYDLKPPQYFYPERDLFGWAVSEETRQSLYDVLPEKIWLPAATHGALLATLEQDARFLCAMRAVDYSLLVVRSRAAAFGRAALPACADERGGMPSDWTYRFCTIDFLTTDTAVRARLTARAVKALGKPDMSFTADPAAYRASWLAMVRDNVGAAAA